MQEGLILKYDTLKDWPDYLKATPFSSTCQLVTQNGKIKLNTFILAAISPFLEQLLSTLPPFIESCIILPDIEWTDMAMFLDSFSTENLTITKSLAQMFGITLSNFTEVCNQVDMIGNIVDGIHIDDLQCINEEEEECDQDNLNQDETINNMNIAVDDDNYENTNNYDKNNQDLLDKVFSTIFDNGNKQEDTFFDNKSDNKKRLAGDILSNLQEYETICPTKKSKINVVVKKQGNTLEAQDSLPTSSVRDATDKKLYVEENLGEFSDNNQIEREWSSQEKSVNKTASKELSGNIQSNHDWFKHMKANFMSAVIGKCGINTRNAVFENKFIEEGSTRRNISKEIIDHTLEYLNRIFGSGNPKVKHTRQVARLLEDTYPVMFKADTNCVQSQFVGYGLGGVRGLKNLPETICQRYRDKFIKNKQKNNNTGPVKKEKVKVVYGVIQEKFYGHIGNKNSAAIEDLKRAKTLNTIEEREKIFSDNRNALMQLVRDSSLPISKVCDGFFVDPRHLKELFVYLTECRISSNVQKNLFGYLENMEEYLRYNDTNLPFQNKLSKMKEDSDLKWIHILRLAGDKFGGDGSSIIRLESDGEPQTAEPHIFATFDGKTYIFELWVEKDRILQFLDLPGCISAFFQLVFCFDLKYPQKSEFLCDFLQRDVAKFGSEEGTRTTKAKITAQNKLAKYRIGLAKAFGAKNVSRN